MDNFFKKAVGLFVDFVPDEKQNHTEASPQPDAQPTPVSAYTEQEPVISQEDADKFEKHFAALFEKANLPGPDYFEFWKMMETLAGHVVLESARMAAVYATLCAQGLNKEKLLHSARHYRDMLVQDQQEFARAADQRMQAEVEGRRIRMQELVGQNSAHAQLIQELSAEIATNQQEIKKLQTQAMEEEQKVQTNRQGYRLASEAMLKKMESDIHKIENTL